MTARKEYGDFQTPGRLARRVASLVHELFGTPEVVIEPNVGLGAFIKASAELWGADAKFIGYDVNDAYVEFAREALRQFGAKVFRRDFFDEDWGRNFLQTKASRILVVGNPPWVTNSELGQLGSKNLPAKSNFQGLRGFDARTGKSNFDIAEWMLIRLIEAIPPEGAVAMLCKTMTARKVLRHFWKTDGGRENSRLFRIDAKAEFNVAVDACLFFVTGKRTDERFATVHDDLDTAATSKRFGLVGGELVSDIDSFSQLNFLDGKPDVYIWRSGIKHDAAKVMEFTRSSQGLINGFGDVVDIEEDCVFPLLKSSDLGNGRSHARKAVLVTQKHTSDDTMSLKASAPKTWEYLVRHKSVLDRRKSSIYKNRHGFSVFGVGPYAFTSWKVAISGLYKNMSFMVIPPCGGRPVMVDDTCYFIPCQSEEEAKIAYELLSSVESKSLLNSLVFPDSKRPITVDVLRRVSVMELARYHGKLDSLKACIGPKAARVGAQTQPFLLLEP